MSKLKNSLRLRAVWVALALVAGWSLTVHSQSELKVGYATLSADGNSSLPVATALFSYRNAEGVLVSEAGVEAVVPVGRGRIVVDSTVATGLALANPSESEVTIQLTLRDQEGKLIEASRLDLGPGEQRARFVSEPDLFGALPDSFLGSLTFESTGEAVAAVTIRQSVNRFQEPLFATLPVVPLDGTRVTDALVFPQVGAGENLSTQIVLVNSTSELLRGSIELVGSDGLPLELKLDGLSGSSFSYELAPDGLFQGILTSESGVQAGYALVTEESDRLPAGAAIFQFRDSGGGLVSEAGVLAARGTGRARIHVDTISTQTGVAIASAENGETRFDFVLRDRSGFEFDQTTRTLPAGGHLSIFSEELFPELPAGFTGVMEIRSEASFFPVSLKLTINQRGDPILTTLPVADLEHPPGNELRVLPQIGFGQGFSTGLILLGARSGLTAAGSLQFRQSNGEELRLELLGESLSRLLFELFPDAAQVMRPDDPAQPAELLLDPSNPAETEVTVNAGGSEVLRPVVIDSAGNLRPDFRPDFTSLDEEVAEVDERGLVRGLKEGFATVVAAAGDRLLPVTVTVASVTSVSDGFAVGGIEQDLAGRLYLTSTEAHALLRAENPGDEPQIYAGVANQAGLRDDARLESLFRGPAFLALDQASGALLVSDRDNHVIRQVDPGSNGRVVTLAGSGRPGWADGAGAAVRFDSPQGLALDTSGRIWIVDTENHVIRRLDRTTGEVVTVAGVPGSAGYADGIGAEARFNRPTGIALERESLAQQLVREVQGEPPPAVTLLVTDTGNGLLRRVSESGLVETVGDTSEGSAADLLLQRQVSRLGAPAAIAVDHLGTIHVGDRESGEIVSRLPNGRVVSAVQSRTFGRPLDLLAASAGELLVSDGLVGGRRIRYGAPLIGSLAPQVVDSRGGETLIIRGRNFAPESVVVISGQLVEAEVVDTRTIRLTVPELGSGVTTVTVQNRGGTTQAPLLVQPVPLADLPSGFITTVAGGTTFVGDGGPARSARVEAVQGLEFDRKGNLYISDELGHRVRRVDRSTGVITTVAGTGRRDDPIRNGELAVTAALDRPQDIVLDKNGDLLVADRDHQQIRRVDLSRGSISRLAGGGSDPGEGVPALAGRLRTPSGLALDRSGVLFFTEPFGRRVRSLDLFSGLLNTVVGTGTFGSAGDGGPALQAELELPVGLAVGPTGDLWIADFSGDRIRRVDRDSGTIEPAVGGGAFSDDGLRADEIRLNAPRDLAFGRGGTLFFSERFASRIRRVDPSSGVVTTVAGTGRSASDLPHGDGGPATEADLKFPGPLAIDGAGNLVFADGDRFIRRVNARTGLIQTLAGTPRSEYLRDGGAAYAAALSDPFGLALDEDQNLYIADLGNHRIRRFDRSTGVITTVAGSDEENPPEDGDGGPATQARLQYPIAVALDQTGNLFIGEYFRIRRVDLSTGLIETVAGDGFSGATGDGGLAVEARVSLFDIALDSVGNLYFADADSSRIRRVDAETGIIETVAGGGNPSDGIGDGGSAIQARLNGPRGVLLDSQGNLWIADTRNHRIRFVDASSGIITTVAGLGAGPELGDGGPVLDARIFQPQRLAWDNRGRLLISQSVGYVRRIELDGTIETVAGSGVGAFGPEGDGGPAIDAGIVAVDVAAAEDGTLFIADSRRHRVRAVRGPLP